MKKKPIVNPGTKGILFGVAAGALLFAASSMLAALILTKNDISYHSVKYICFGATIVSSFLAGYISKKHVKIKGLLAGLLASSVLVALIFSILCAVNHFRFGEDAYLLIPSGILFGILGGIISSNMR